MGHEPTERADLRLVALGLCDSRSRAKAEIEAGNVFIGGRQIVRASEKLPLGAEITLCGGDTTFVSRAALKLVHGLDHFGILAAGRHVLDLGASTGGFSQVVLERGAAGVIAVDVGHGQLHHRLAGAARLRLLEGLNAKEITRAHVPPETDLIVCDLSFIGLRTALPPALGLMAAGAELVALIKPQFEAGPKAGSKGVIRDAAVHDRVCAEIAEWLTRDMKWSVLGLTPSPIEGREGNKEFLIAARKA